MDFAEIEHRFTSPATVMQSAVREAFRARVDYQKALSGQNVIYLEATGIEDVKTLATRFIDAVMAIKGKRTMLFCEDLPVVMADPNSAVPHMIAYIRGSWM